MADDIKKAQEEINREIDDAYNRLEELKDNDEHLVEELSELDKLRHRYHVLSEISDQLEKLEKLGGSDMFWGENYDRSHAQNEQKRIRDQVINYDSRVAELQRKQAEREESVESLTAKINVLNDESLNLQEREEARAEEFVIEREMATLPYRPMRMPWNGDDEDQRQFRKILLIVLLFSFLLGILIPMWDIPVPDRVEVVEIPERLAQLMVPKKEPPPPPKPKKKEEKLPDKEKPKKKEDKPVPEKAKKARKKAERAGLMAFKDDFADLIDDTPIKSLGSKAKISGKGSKAKKTTRSLVTSSVGTSSSGGINTAALSRNTGGAGDGIGGVEFSRVESSIGSDFYGEEAPLSSGPGPSRTDEEIQIVFDRYKSALYRIYNRELRKNPTLQGKMVLRLTIEPDGKVSACSVDSSDMDAPALDKKIADRVKKFNFGAKEGVPSITILYPIDFLPAT
ncbi:MAG: TonB family protein [Gammaproteobacteria bacterium]|nr:TonB family protein [Gammaproteobacteria bacterium]MBT8135242.1 TonB family protein [Gammaproteobacteria bacterium]NNJ51529.1 TonB family protein [Gammaproteobacteria bacterium]